MKLIENHVGKKGQQNDACGNGFFFCRIFFTLSLSVFFLCDYLCLFRGGFFKLIHFTAYHCFGRLRTVMFLFLYQHVLIFLRGFA